TSTPASPTRPAWPRSWGSRPRRRSRTGWRSSRRGLRVRTTSTATSARSRSCGPSGCSTGAGRPEVGGSTRRTVLILGESVALAHVGRPVVLARALDPDRYDVHVAFDPRHEWVAREAPAGRYHPLASITPEAFLSTPPGRSYTLDELRGYLADERRLYEEVQPDLVVADFRPTAPTSGAAAGIPVATLVNAHWSPHRRLGFPASPPRDPSWRATLAS